MALLTDIGGGESAETTDGSAEDRVWWGAQKTSC